MFSLTNIKRHLNDQGGFSLAEVVMAVFLFTSAVLGVSGLVISGGADVARGASESLASNMANKKIEAVRSLPFYRPWSNKNQDIDDFYFNTAKTNKQQLDNPGSTEDYGTIPGASAYKRTTAVQYQVVSGFSMAAAEMDPDWVPKEPGSTQIDRPTTSGGVTLHSLVVEVSVYYRVGGQERVYKQRTLAGDMIIPGGSSIPVLLIKSISPTNGPTTQTDQVIKVTVEAQEALTGTFEVRLWASGVSDIVGTSVGVISQNEIDAHFNLAASGINPGQYNMSVNWKDNGWIDKGFRNCFKITGPVPTISSINNYNWGYKTQSSRQVTINGTNLTNATYVQLLGPNEGGTAPPPQGSEPPATPTPADSIQCGGRVVSATSTKLVASFNLGNVPDDSFNTKWTVQVGSWGGVASSDTNNRLLVNPKPQVTSVTFTPTTLYRKGSYSNPVLVKGKYFQTGVNVRLSRTSCNDIKSPYATGGTVTETDYVGTTQFTAGSLDLRLRDASSSDELIKNRPIVNGGSVSPGNEVGPWTLYADNPDGQESAQTTYTVAVDNAPLKISSISPATTTQVYNDWDIPVTSITGNYFDPDHIKVNFYDDYGITGTATVTGAYGTNQTISGLLMNTIGLDTTTTYKITVTDTENLLTSTDANSITSYKVVAPGNNAVVMLPAGTSAPAGCSWPHQNAFWNDSSVPGHDTDLASATNICNEKGNPVGGTGWQYDIIAKRMKAGVTWYFKPASGNPKSFTASGVAYIRQQKYVRATGLITWDDYSAQIINVGVGALNGGSGPSYTSNRVRIQGY